MEQQDDRSIGGSGFAVEDLDTIGVDCVKAGAGE